MFAEVENPPSSATSTAVSGSGSGPGGVAASRSSVDEVMWEFKWKDTEEAEVHGPFSSTQMGQWAEEG